MTEEQPLRPERPSSQRNRIKLKKEETAKLVLPPGSSTPLRPGEVPPVDPASSPSEVTPAGERASAGAEAVPPDASATPAKLTETASVPPPVGAELSPTTRMSPEDASGGSSEEASAPGTGIGFAVAPSGLMPVVKRPRPSFPEPVAMPVPEATPPAPSAVTPGLRSPKSHVPGVGFDIMPSGVIQQPRKRLTTRKFLAGISNLLGSGPEDATVVHPGAPLLTEEDPLTASSVNETTKMLLAARLGRPSRRLSGPTETIPAIVVEDLDATYETKQVLFDLKFSVNRGEILAILGGSGSGKTTLLKHLIGLLRPSRGKIVIAGQDIANLEGDELALVLKSIGMLFQYSALFNSITIAQNVALPLREYTNLPEAAIDAIVRLKLALVGLPGVANMLASELSGGMKKRAALARALALDPDVLFFDEPASGLDPIAAAALDQQILHLNRSFGTTMVIVTHDLENAFNVAHRILMLDQGRIRKIGTPAEVRASKDAWVTSFLARSTALRDAVDERFFSKLGVPGKESSR